MAFAQTPNSPTILNFLLHSVLLIVLQHGITSSRSPEPENQSHTLFHSIKILFWLLLNTVPSLHTPRSFSAWVPIFLNSEQDSRFLGSSLCTLIVFTLHYVYIKLGSWNELTDLSGGIIPEINYLYCFHTWHSKLKLDNQWIGTVSIWDPSKLFHLWRMVNEVKIK